MEKISFVIPCYRSERTIADVVNEIEAVMGKLSDFDYEIILVNDSSPENVWNSISELCAANHRIIGVNLAKNFGQPSAVMAGFSKVSGDYIITLDDDGQSPVDATEAINYKIKTENYDVVYGVCKKAKFGVIRRLGSKINALMANYAFDRPADRRIISFCIYKRFVVEEMKKYHNSYTYLSGLTYRTTKNIGYLDVVHRNRAEGTSGYSFKKLIKLWVNGLTAFSIRPLRISMYFGGLLAIVGFLFAFVIIARKLLNQAIEAGWSSLMCMLLVLNGISFIMLGRLGEYVGRIYMSANSAPQFVIKEVINYKEKG